MMWLKIIVILIITKLALGIHVTPDYDEKYARLMFYLSAAAYSDNPETCLTNR